MAVETDFSWRRLSFLQKNKQFKSSGKEPRLFILRLKMMAFHKNLETLNLHIQVRFTIQVSKCKSICLSQIFKEWQEGSWFCFSAGSNGFLKSLTPLYRMTFFFFLPLWQWRGSFFLTDSQCQIPSTFIELLHLFGLTVTLLTSFSGYRLLLPSLWILRRTCSFYTNRQHCKLKGFFLDSTTSVMFLLFFAFWWLFLVLPTSKWDTSYFQNCLQVAGIHLTIKLISFPSP